MFLKNFTLYFFTTNFHKLFFLFQLNDLRKFVQFVVVFFYIFFVTNDLILKTASGINFPASGKSVKSGVSGSVSAFGV